MTEFTCNVCGRRSQVVNFNIETPTCSCGSNVRIRASIHLLSMELFGQSLALTEFPRLKAIRALGMSDNECYAGLLAEKFDYTNTFYDREPRFDFTESHPLLWGGFDFVVSADVLEHVAPPVERALEEVQRLLKPHGFLLATVPCPTADRTEEHFPDLHTYRVFPLGNSAVLVNRRRDGTLEVRDDLVFHEGHGATLEMRQFGVAELETKLRGAGFREVCFFNSDVPEAGILFESDASQPLIARKEAFVLDRPAQRQLISLWLAIRKQRDQAEGQMHLASESRWVRIGRRFGVGPEFVYAASDGSADPPLRLDAAGPFAAQLLGPEWYPPDGGHRWMPKRATFRIGGPAQPGQKLHLRGYCGQEQMRSSPLTLTVTIDHSVLPPALIAANSGSNSFELCVPLPGRIVGKRSVYVSIEVDRTFSLPSDPRELGLAFGIFEVR